MTMQDISNKFIALLDNVNKRHDLAQAILKNTDEVRSYLEEDSTPDELKVFIMLSVAVRTGDFKEVDRYLDATKANVANLVFARDQVRREHY